MAGNGVASRLDIGTLGIDNVEEIDESCTFSCLSKLVNICTASHLGEKSLLPFLLGGIGSQGVVNLLPGLEHDALKLDGCFLLAQFTEFDGSPTTAPIEDGKV